jgi:ABC-type Na+ transport system ATPase subunit NatA
MSDNLMKIPLSEPIAIQKDDMHALLTCTDRFICLRLMAQVFGFSDLEVAARMGEEISIKSVFAHTQFRMKECTDALWDALTTMEHVVSVGVVNSREELRILAHRLEKQLDYVRTLDTSANKEAHALEQEIRIIRSLTAP